MSPKPTYRDLDFYDVHDEAGRTVGRVIFPRRRSAGEGRGETVYLHRSARLRSNGGQRPR